MLTKALTDPDDRKPDLSACRWPAKLVSSCFYMHDLNYRTFHGDLRKKGQKLINATAELFELLKEERTRWASGYQEKHATLSDAGCAGSEREWIERDLQRYRSKVGMYDSALASLRDVHHWHSMSLPDVPSWHDMAEEILIAFRDAMSQANPDRTYGTSNPGPAVRFINICFLEILGQDIATGTIAKALQRAAGTNDSEQNVTRQKL